MRPDIWQEKRALIEQLQQYVWTSEPLPARDDAPLREAIGTQESALISLLDKLGRTPLIKEQRESLRLAIARNLLAIGFNGNQEPNERGIRLEALIDYLGQM